MAKKLTAVNIVNAINNQVNTIYKSTLPAVTVENFKDMAAQLTQAPDTIRNAWQDALVNLVGLQHAKNKRAYEGYFKNLYKADTATENIQLYMADLLETKVFSPDANTDEFFEDAKADIGTQYITSTVKTVVPLSVNEDTLMAAFVTPGAFDEFFDNLVSRMYDTMENFDVQAVKELINANIEQGNLYIVPMAEPVDKETSLAWTADIKARAEDMRVEMDNIYNLSHFHTWTPADDGVVIGTTKTVSIAETYSLAFAFNKKYLDLKERGQFITIPSSGLAGGKVYGGYIDRDAFEIRNKIGFPRATSQFFGNSLTTKRWLHNQKIMAISFFNNAVFYADPAAVGITSATLATKDGSANANRGSVKWVYVKSITAEEGKIADKFGTFTVSGANSAKTEIDANSGKLTIGRDETAENLTVTWTSHLDAKVTAQTTITINQ